MIEMMSYYRDAELHGATLLLRLIKLMDDPDAQVKLSLHLADETRHAWLWTKRINELGGEPMKVARRLPEAHRHAHGPAVAARDPGPDGGGRGAVVRALPGARQADPASTRRRSRCSQEVTKDEKWHIAWIRSKLMELAARRAARAGRAAIEKYRQIDEQVYGELRAKEIEAFGEHRRLIPLSPGESSGEAISPGRAATKTGPTRRRHRTSRRQHHRRPSATDSSARLPRRVGVLRRAATTLGAAPRRADRRAVLPARSARPAHRAAQPAARVPRPSDPPSIARHAARVLPQPRARPRPRSAISRELTRGDGARLRRRSTIRRAGRRRSTRPPSAGRLILTGALRQLRAARLRPRVARPSDHARSPADEQCPRSTSADHRPARARRHGVAGQEERRESGAARAARSSPSSPSPPTRTRPAATASSSISSACRRRPPRVRRASPC